MKSSIKLNRRGRWLVLVVLGLAIVSFDLATTGSQALEGAFRPESGFKSFDYPKATVAIVPSDYSALASPVARTANPSYEQVEAMVRKAIELQGGLNGVVKKKDKVMLKVNLVGANSASGNGENTDVRVVKSLLKIIHEHTGGEVELWVAEGSARNNDDVSSTTSVWANSGYRDLLTDPYLAGINFKLLNLNQPVSDMVEVDLGEKSVNAYQGSKYKVHKSILEADVYIAVPVLKIHDTGMTSALKLQIGIAPGCIYGYNKMAGTTLSKPLYHDVAYRCWTDEAIVDLSTISDIDFVVVDALMCLDQQKTDKTSNRVRFNAILAGSDPVAVDHVGTLLFGMNPDDIIHITLAEKAGLGTNQKGNITVVGAPVTEVMKRVRKNQSEKGVFGQSNRTWILSKAFQGTDMDQDYIGGEASLKPLPGKDGWSEATYFFDDRIDLLSYYNDATNIVSYCFTHFYAPKAQNAELWMTAHEAVKVYLNGKNVYEKSTTTTMSDKTYGNKVATIDLKAGDNALMVKTLNQFGDYTFTLNICEVESDPNYAGNRVEGLKFFQGLLSGNKELKVSDQDIAITAWPNPAENQVQFTCSTEVGTSGGSIDIFDSSGKRVKTIKVSASALESTQIKWDLVSDQGGKVGRGTYVCTYSNSKGKSSLRLLIR